MAKLQEMNKIKKIVTPILRKNNVVKAGLFGSLARGDTKKKRDIDILIQFKGKKSLLDLVRLKDELESKTKKEVDVLTYKSINRYLRKNILKEEVRIF